MTGSRSSRGALVEAGAQATWKHLHDASLLTWDNIGGWEQNIWRSAFTAALDAALAVTIEGVCETCGGSGDMYDPTVTPDDLHLQVSDCPTCHGSGRTPPRLAVVDVLGMEQVRVCDFTDADDGTLRRGEPTVPLYRAVPPKTVTP